MDWTLAMTVVCGILIACVIAWHEGYMYGTRYMEELYQAHVRELDRIMDHGEIKAWLEEGRR